MATTRARSSAASVRISSRWSIAVATSSKVVGQPPPATRPSRRYSMFHAAHPRAARSCAERAHQLAPVARAPEPAVDHDGDGERPVAAGHVELAELGAARPVVVPLDACAEAQAATPSERSASASRVMPSSICSGVTPE